MKKNKKSSKSKCKKFTKNKLQKMTIQKLRLSINKNSLKSLELDQTNKNKKIDLKTTFSIVSKRFLNFNI